MDAASRVIVAGRLCGQDRAVCVACDQDVMVFFGPSVQAKFTFVFDMVIFGCAGGIQNAQVFQRVPEIPDKETGERPECGIEQAGLVPVRQIEGYMGTVTGQQVCGEDNALMEGEGGKERLHLLGLCTEEGITAFGRVAFFSFDNIMVAVDKIKSLLQVKLFKKPENVAVDVYDIFHAPVFPKLIPVPQFDIGKALSVIMPQRGEIQVLVFQEVIGGIADAPVTVAHEDIPGAVREREKGSICEGAVKTRKGTHGQVSLQ